MAHDRCLFTRELDVGQNDLSGMLPVELGSLNALAVMSIYNAGQTGPIPVEYTQLANLTVLDLSGNIGLSGAVPDSVGDLQQLGTL